MKEIEKRRPELEKEEARRKEEVKRKPKDPRDNLVKFLSEGDHPIEVVLRPEKSIERLKKVIDQGYVHIKFTDTRGGTELGVRLTECDSTHASFENNIGEVNIVGDLILNCVKVRCIAKIEPEILIGTGYLIPLEE